MFLKSFIGALIALFFTATLATEQLAEGQVAIQNWFLWCHDSDWVFNSTITPPLTATKTDAVTTFEIPVWEETKKSEQYATFLVTDSIPKYELRGMQLILMFRAFNGAQDYVNGSDDKERGKYPKKVFVKGFFSSKEEYTLKESADLKWGGASRYWWSDQEVTLDSGEVQIIKVSFDPENWSNGMSQRGTNVIHLWSQALRDIKSVGIAFSGDRHYDVGFASPAILNSGEVGDLKGKEVPAQFEMLGFFISPPDTDQKRRR